MMAATQAEIAGDAPKATCERPADAARSVPTRLEVYVAYATLVLKTANDLMEKQR